MPEEKTGLEQLNRLKSGHPPLVQALFDEAYACGHKDGRANGEAVIGMLEAARSERDRLTADAQRWAMIRDTVIRLDAVARPGMPMGDEDILQVVLRVLERAARPTTSVVSSRVATMQAAGLCPRGGEIVDYTIGLCSCMECPTPRPGWVAK